MKVSCIFFIGGCNQSHVCQTHVCQPHVCQLFLIFLAIHMSSSLPLLSERVEDVHTVVKIHTADLLSNKLPAYRTIEMLGLCSQFSFPMSQRRPDGCQETYFRTRLTVFYRCVGGGGGGRGNRSDRVHTPTATMTDMLCRCGHRMGILQLHLCETSSYTAASVTVVICTVYHMLINDRSGNNF